MRSSLSRPTPALVRFVPADLRLAARLVVGAAVALVALELVARWLTPGLTPWLHATLALVAWELSVQLLVTRAAVARTAAAPTSTARAVSVLVAAWNEERDVVATVRSILAQEGVALEILVADDGSTDATRRVLREAFSLVPVEDARDGEERSADGRLRVLSLPHRGKGAALEAARRAARHPILVTVDADTVLGPGAIERLTRPFADPRVEAAAGSVVVRGARETLSRFQYVEYLRTTFLRRGWSELALLEQVPGAFAALRASAVDHAGGFPTDSLTEDYEVMFRLYAAAAEEGRRIRVPTVHDACAYTEPPRTLGGLARQRTRWFAGFLVTLHRFRALTLDPRAGAFGLVRMPLKWIDAITPPWALGSLVIVAALVLAAPAGARLETSAIGALLLGLRLAVDVAQTWLALRAHQRSHGRIATLEPRAATTWLHALADAWSYAWLRQLLVLRAYPFALRRARTWETAR